MARVSRSDVKKCGAGSTGRPALNLNTSVRRKGSDVACEMGRLAPSAAMPGGVQGGRGRG